uniref:Mitogen-activated protein kinase kinase kinase n=1 Tax=Macrostomum lignano TaxID=282301 RepID=A0A1I8IHR8_9PLAT
MSSTTDHQMVMVIQPDDIRRGHEQLGRGTYGTVYRGRWQGIDVAIKLFDAQRDVASLQKEMSLLARCQHPNIVRLFGVWLGPTEGERPSSAGSASDFACPYYVMELADSGTVADVVHNRPTHRAGFLLVPACAKAVAYLHAHQPRPIIHRDLKSMNLLLFNAGRVLKVCDFGTVREQSTDMTSSKGTVAWMAPEILTNNRYSPSVDVYSLGMVMWEVLARSRPFKDMNSYSIMFHIHAGQRPPQFRDCPETLRNLLAACLHQEPSRRPPITGLVELLGLVAPRLPGYHDGLIEPQTEASFTVDGKVGSSAAGGVGEVGTSKDSRPMDEALIDADVEVTEDPPPPSMVIPEASPAPAAGASMSLRPDQLQLMRVIWEELPVELLPPQALPGHTESEAIFAEHQRLLNEYTTEQMTLMRLTQEQKDLEQNLLQLVSREQLLELLELKQRLDELRRSQGGTSSATAAAVGPAQRSLSALELNFPS